MSLFREERPVFNNLELNPGSQGSDTSQFGGIMVYCGAATTRDTVRAEVGLTGAIGSLYTSTAGKLYLKVANAGATTDWQKVTATAAD